MPLGVGRDAVPTIAPTTLPPLDLTHTVDGNGEDSDYWNDLENDFEDYWENGEHSSHLKIALAVIFILVILVSCCCFYACCTRKKEKTVVVVPAAHDIT